MFDFKSFPERITIELTNKCNLNCSFCPRHISDMKLGFLSSELYYKIVDEASKYLPVCLVFFFRGESLLHPQLVEFINYAHKKGFMPIQLASNGLFLDSNISDKIIKSGLDFISFSLDTNDENLYNKARKQGNIHQTRQNVINFSNKCKKLKINGHKVPEIQVSTVDIEEYKSGQKEFIDFWLQYVDKVRVYVEHSHDKNLGSISNNTLNFDIERKTCKKIYTDMVVYWDGTVALCNHDWNNKLKIGNINNQSIYEIWNSEKYNQIRNFHEKNNISDELVCKNCDHWKMYYLQEGFLGKIYAKQ